jgi:hypothetical protein
VRLAVGRSFSDCSPVKGMYRGGAEHTLEVQVSVQYDEILEETNPPKLFHLSNLIPQTEEEILPQQQEQQQQ